jgi:hypothetical protein
MKSACAILYFHSQPVRLCNIFPHHLTNGTILGKTTIEHKMCVLIFPKNLVRNTSHSKKNSARYHKCKQVFTKSTRNSSHFLIKLLISRQICEKPINIKFNQNPSRESRVVPCERTDWHTHMTNPIVAFQDFANEPKNAQIYTKKCPFYHVPAHRPLSRGIIAPARLHPPSV